MIERDILEFFSGSKFYSKPFEDGNFYVWDYFYNFKEKLQNIFLFCNLPASKGFTFHTKFCYYKVITLANFINHIFGITFSTIYSLFPIHKKFIIIYYFLLYQIFLFLYKLDLDLVEFELDEKPEKYKVDQKSKSLYHH